MTCRLKRRIDDIPKRHPKEKTWVCDDPDCNAIIFAVGKPRCRQDMLRDVQRRHDEAVDQLDAIHVIVKS